MSGQPFIKPTTAFDRRAMGKYDVLCRLASGGMSEILLAHQKGLAGFRKIVVLKTILADIRGEEDFVRMFLEEARTTAAFNHPHVAQVYDLDVDDGTLFLAMEFVPGCTLVEMARACRAAKEPIPIGFTLMAVRDSALALHYAHTFVDPRGKKQVVIHRDVAEKNIMVTFDGVTKLLDFGIAKSIGRKSHTSVGMVKGTSGYMSPEQIRGEPLDPRSDIFSLGVVAHECLTGMRLFHGKSAEEGMLAALRDEVQAPSLLNPSVTAEIDGVVMKALSREREGRYSSALELARAIEKVAVERIWRSEESAELVQRMFAERRTQTRELIAQSRNIGEATGELVIDRVLEAVGLERFQAGAAPVTSAQRTLATTTASSAPPQAAPTPIDLSARRAAVTRSQNEARPWVTPPAPPMPGALQPGTDPSPQAQRSTLEDFKAVVAPAIDPVLPAATINLSPPTDFDDDDDGAKTIPAGDLKALFAKANMEMPPGLVPRPSLPPAGRQPSRPELPRPEPELPQPVAPPPENSITGETLSQSSTLDGPSDDIDDRPDAADRTAVGRPFEPPSQPAGTLDEEPATRLSAPSGGRSPPERSGLSLLAYMGMGVLLALAAAAVLYLAGVLPPGQSAPPPVEIVQPPKLGAGKPAGVRPAPARSEVAAPERAAQPAPVLPEQRPARPAPGETPGKVDAAVVAPTPGGPVEAASVLAAPKRPPAPVTAVAVVASPKKPLPKRVVRPQVREEPELLLEEGTLTLATEPECEVFFEGRSLGRTPLTKVSLPGGAQTLKLLGPDGTKSWKVDIKPRDNVSKRVALSEL
jgi:eukaryotic-like serine/threonine-protein kinase